MTDTSTLEEWSSAFLSGKFWYLCIELHDIIPQKIVMTIDHCQKNLKLQKMYLLLYILFLLLLIKVFFFFPQKSRFLPWINFSILVWLGLGCIVLILRLVQVLEPGRLIWVNYLCWLMNGGWQNMDVRDVESYINGSKGYAIMFDLNVGNLLSFTAAFVLTKHTEKKISTGIVFYCTKWVRTRSSAEYVQYERNENGKGEVRWYVYLVCYLWELSRVVPVL